MKVYVSSTYQDLREHRAAVDRALRRMGHDVIGMEQYVAEGAKPLERCLADVRACDVYLLLLAWRYGYIPKDPARNPDERSITRLEYDEAKQVGKPVLAFLLDPAAPWPPNQLDAMSADQRAAAGITEFRDEVGTSYLAGIFRTPDDLASQAAAAVAAQGLGLRMVERLLEQTTVTADSMGAFGSGSHLIDTTVMSIKQTVAGVGSDRAIVVDLGNGDQWWSTRLYLLASLLHALTAVRQIVFRQASGRFAGMASPSAVLDGLAAVFPALEEFRRRLRDTPASQDTQRETDRQVQVWNLSLIQPEEAIKVGVRPELLPAWIGDRLVTRCIKVDENGPTMAQVQQIVESLLPDVPIERSPSPPEEEPVLQVVDRDAFALELAREWVRSALPRTPIR